MVFLPKESHLCLLTSLLHRKRSLVSIEGPQNFSKLTRNCHGREMFFLNRLECSSQISADIALALSSRDCISKNLTTSTKSPVCGVNCSAFFDLQDSIQHFFGLDLLNWPLADLGEHVINEPGKHFFR